MASIENPTEKAIDKATEGTATVTSTPIVNSDFSTGQTLHVFSKGIAKVEIEIYSSDDARPTYFVADALTSFSSASDLTVYRESKDGPVVANIRLPSSKTKSPSAAVITYPALQATIVPVTAREEILSTQQCVRIDGRDYVWQGEKRGDHPGLPIQVLKDEQDNTKAKFVWDAKGRPEEFGRLLLVDTGVKQDLLDQIVATAVARVFQEAKREKVNSIGGNVIGPAILLCTVM